jgi:lipopolysaccharide/colanic/teichoic acid biosynthesis glycosyltransferase
MTTSREVQSGHRLFDLVVAGASVIVLSPLILVLALLVKLTSKGPVLFRACRVGRDGQLFDVLKFRTMRAGAHASGPGITRAGDPRITPVGRWLRRTKLDELPQLVNVLRGEMGMVGPRPEDPRYVEGYTPAQRAVLSVRPGMTSPASIRYRHEERLLARDDWERYYRDVVIPDKIRMELEYLARRSVRSDLRILFGTFVRLANLEPHSKGEETSSS